MAKTPRGLNTEVAGHLLPKGQHAQFRNLTYEAGTIRPRASDEAFTPGVTGWDPWIYTNLGSKSFVSLDFGETTGELMAYCDLAGSATSLRNTAGSVDIPVALAVPGAPSLLRWTYTTGAAPRGIGTGESRSYSVAWKDAIGHTGIGSIVTVTNDIWVLAIGAITGNAPSEVGMTITNATKGKTASLHDYQSGVIIITESGKSGAGTWELGDALTWTGGSASMTADEATARGLPYIDRPASPPASATHWLLYGLDDSGTWRLVNGTGAAIAALSDQDDGFFPFETNAFGTAETTTYLPAYDGPVDAEGLVQTCVVPPTAQLVSLHRWSLFVAAGRYIYPSERFGYRWFLAEERLDAGSTITGMVSRAEYLEVYTDKTVLLVLGDYPNLEIRDLRVNGGPAAWDGIAAAGVGTFLYIHDEQTPAIYRLGNDGLSPITAGLHTPWLRFLSSATGVILGADESSLLIVDKTVQANGTYRCLAYDWRVNEWWDRELAALPTGFRYDPTSRVLVGKTGASSYVKYGTGTSAVSWVLEMREDRHPRAVDAPVFLLFDADGVFTLSLYADDLLVHSRVVPTGGERETILPEVEAYSLRYVLSGSGTNANTEIRGMSGE